MLIWCTNDSNVYIRIFLKRWSLVLGSFFPVNTLKVIFGRVCKSLYHSTLLYGISYQFSETLTEVAVRRKIYKWLYWNLRTKWWKVSVVATIFSNDECARLPTQLKTESTTDILIGQVDKFQNSCFQKHLWKVGAA